LHVNLQDEIGRVYIKAGPYQLKLLKYPISRMGNNRRPFQASWFMTYLIWTLKYSPSKNVIFCLSCYVFVKKSTGRPRLDEFTEKNFDN
jgi:hypothetical protein